MASNQQQLKIPMAQMICAAQIFGVILVSGVLTFLRMKDTNPAPQESMTFLFTIIAVVVALGSGFVGILVKMVLLAKAAPENAETAFATASILGMAIAETGGIFGAVYIFLTGQIPMGLFLVLVSQFTMILHFPTQGKMEDLLTKLHRDKRDS